MKLSIQVDEHVCELQLHLQSFLSIKNERGHAIYEKTRLFSVPGAIEFDDIIADTTPESTKAMNALKLGGC